MIYVGVDIAKKTHFAARGYCFHAYDSSGVTSR